MDWKLIDILLSFLIPGAVLVHLVLAPFTKVEESFNLQAAHDVLSYGTPTANIEAKLRAHYDHFTFPGAVPRTFIGPVLLAGIGQPFVILMGAQWAQTIVRLVLGMFNAGCMVWFKKNIEGAFGKPTARWYAMLQASQFHVTFYASRTLPNMFAFGLTTLAFANLLPVPLKPTGPRHRLALTFFVFAAVIFRSEVALLLATTFLTLLVTRRTTIARTIVPFIVSSTAALVISVPIDSYFWQRFLWPELAGFWYNAIQGKSSDWGTSPPSWYFVNALPKMLMSSLPLIPIPFFRPATRTPAAMLVTPCLAFVAIYSIQPHKEARFIFYVVPPLTATAAMGANTLWTLATTPFLASSKKTDDKEPRAQSNGSLFSLLTAAVLVIAVLGSFLISTVMLGFSSLNYPGGDALNELARLIARTNRTSNILVDGSVPPVSVHADVLSCMTGISLFELSAASSVTGFDIALDRTENPQKLAVPGFWDQFSWALAEDPEPILNSGGDWHVVSVVEGFAGVEQDFDPDPTRDVETAPDEGIPVVGQGLSIRRLKGFVKCLTGGRWIGPRMDPKINILYRGRLEETEKVADGIRVTPR
ncbi:glycosyltransferase family 22 protein [Zalerion maritima]|uniref:Mannosyltransferase n=1 Tax=Zalerion maritima TaxID=339359 RepID=A0AAD5RZ08_9PEZI|nr:glycosyltransferase family 22 protein [Zalerion maritima]